MGGAAVFFENTFFSLLFDALSLKLVPTNCIIIYLNAGHNTKKSTFMGVAIVISSIPNWYLKAPLNSTHYFYFIAQQNTLFLHKIFTQITDKKIVHFWASQCDSGDLKHNK